jgi:2-polyprenyl-3-methyl-5-hydroxy-6-metoxy-1,4-benzoquinol methylase
LVELNYSYTAGPEDPVTSHAQAVRMVTPGSTVLDVGAADGSVARPLSARGCRVWAVELDPGAAGKARAACERVIVGDVEAMDLEALLADQQFDYILCLDVLEHLRDPLAVLTRLRKHLATGGRVIASIPNVAHGAVRLSLLSGAFKYTRTGLLDSAHMRFFDRAGAEGLFADTGLRIVERLQVVRGLTETEIPVDPTAVAPAVLQQIRDDPDATTYQFILVGMLADTANATALGTGGVSSTEMHGRDLQLHMERVTSHASLLDIELRDVRAELERRMEELAIRHMELRHLRADLVVKEAFVTELRADLVAKKASIAELREELARLRTFANSPGIRMASAFARTLSRYPRTRRFMQRGVHRVLGNSKT